MENVSKIWLGDLPKDSPYLQAVRFNYVQNKCEKNWDFAKRMDSIVVIIYNKTRNCLVFVKQFRPAVYHGVVSSLKGDTNNIDLEKFPPKLGITLELCAGIIDKDKSFAEIAREEVLEECGYNVPLENLEEVMTYRSGVGASGQIQVMYYCQVTDEDKVEGAGGGVDEEIIEVVEYTIDQCKDLVKQGAIHNSPPSFLFGVLWFLTNRASK